MCGKGEKMGRLIDADSLIEKLETWQSEAAKIGADVNYTFASAVIAQVNMEPTVEPERRTGKWIPCDERLPDKTDFYLIQYIPYYAPLYLYLFY